MVMGKNRPSGEMWCSTTSLMPAKWSRGPSGPLRRHCPHPALMLARRGPGHPAPPGGRIHVDATLLRRRHQRRNAGHGVGRQLALRRFLRRAQLAGMGAGNRELVAFAGRLAVPQPVFARRGGTVCPTACSDSMMSARSSVVRRGSSAIRSAFRFFICSRSRMI